ncbi:MAG TPA: hypothetical protein VGP68_16255 [Gemmataceae bacterium]|jgi:lipopolysaccharide export system protein LptA|nr:hypothetical protein [Gemmataceae bacterium]
MWTPKRIVLLVGWIAFFGGAYAGSSFLMGSIDGLPPLPDRYKPIDGLESVVFPVVQREFGANTKLRLAFGEGSPEVKSRKFKLEIESKGLVLAAQEVTIEPDGKAKLVPFSVAVFSKDKGEKPANTFPEITTIQADTAYLTFNRPLKSLTDMNDRKIIFGDLTGNIKIINNRGTAERTDDVSLFTQGMLHYDEARHHVWTSDPVQILDLRSKPQPTTIDGVGADLYLTAETAKEAPAATATASKSKNKNQSTSGVERVELRSDVMMHLWVDSKSGLLGPPQDTKPANNNGKAPPQANAVAGNKLKAKEAKPDGKAPAPAVAAAAGKAAPANGAAEKKPDEGEENAHVVIDTQGPFAYDFKTDKAIFEISKLAGPRPNLVTVDRCNEQTKMSDQLKCDRLEIQFARKDATAGSTAASSPDKLEIETVKATGNNVVLTSDAEVLEAHGNEFTYNSKTLVSVLKGTPYMDALKEGNEIRAPELHMVNVKGAQNAEAIGEGTMNFWGTAGSKKPQEARWKNKLTYFKEGDKDLLTLYGNAIFLDPEHEQELKADTLKVLMKPTEAGPANADNSQKKPSPTQVDAIGSVTANSADMHIHDTDRLILLFKDVAPGSLPPPNAPVKAGVNGKPAEVAANGKPAEAGANGKPAEATASNQTGLVGANGADPNKKPRPVDLKARFVQAQILRDGARNELETVYCQGAVRVLQAPEKPGENGVDIRGDTLNLTHRPDGDILTVMGDHAQVQMDQLFILGPEINMDQTRNDVEVKGMGVMRMLSKQSFDGKELVKPSELRVEWEGRMYFDGTQASFFKNVYATQDTGRMKCEELQVTLDRHVNLKEGNKGEQPAVEKLVCHIQVGLEDTKREGNKIIEFKRISATEVAVDNDKESKERIVNASGPGCVRMFQLSSKDDAFDSPQKNPDPKDEKRVPSKTPANAAPSAKSAPGAKGATGAPADEKEFKLTLIWFTGKMFANNNLGIARFYDKVTVIQVPTEDPNLVIKDGESPPGYMLLKCERMEVLERKQANGTTSQELRAYDKVYVEGRNYSANCDVLKYDAGKEQIILEAAIPGTYAVLYKEKYRGSQRDKIEAKKIFYDRITGDYQAEGSRGTTVSP